MGVLSLVCIYIIHLTYESQEKSAISIKRLIKIVRRKEHPSDRFNEERCKQKKSAKKILFQWFMYTAQFQRTIAKTTKRREERGKKTHTNNVYNFVPANKS